MQEKCHQKKVFSFQNMEAAELVRALSAKQYEPQILYC